jgi:hypothetical protein
VCEIISIGRSLLEVIRDARNKRNAKSNGKTVTKKSSDDDCARRAREREREREEDLHLFLWRNANEIEVRIVGKSK